MKKYFAIVLLAIIVLAGCKTTPIKHELQCDKPIDQLFKSITGLMVQEGYDVVAGSIDIGFLKFQHKTDIWVGGKDTWEISYVDGKINAYAYLDDNTKIYMGNWVHPDQQTWYWTMREKLENLCQYKIIVHEK